MSKMFERADLTANDDGTFSISITPVRKETKGEGGEIAMDYGSAKTYTAASLEEAIGKIQSYAGAAPAEDTVEPETGEDGDDMDTFMEPRIGEIEKDETDYKGE